MAIFCPYDQLHANNEDTEPGKRAKTFQLHKSESSVWWEIDQD